MVFVIFQWPVAKELPSAGDFDAVVVVLKGCVVRVLWFFTVMLKCAVLCRPCSSG